MNRITLGWVAIGVLASTGFAQAPWPMERQDRWGTGRAVFGPDPSTYTAPWVFRNFANIGLVSHAPALVDESTAYVNTWVNNTLQLFSPSTGATGWTFSTLDFGQSSPAVGSDGAIFVANVQNFDNDPPANLYRVNPTTHDYDWFFRTYTRKVSDFDACSPTIGPDGNIVYGSTTGTAWKINSQTGAPIWTRAGLGGIIRTIVFSRDDTLVFASNGNSISALRYSDGTVAWTKALDGLAGAPGTAPDGTVVVGTSNGTVYGLDPATDATRWTFSALQAVAGAPAFSTDGVAYIGSYDRRLYALRVSDGQRNWSVTSNDQLYTAPSVGFDGRIYFGTRSGWLYSVDPSGNVVWNFLMNNECRGPMSIGADGALYVPNNELRVIRQQAAGLQPDGFSLPRGILVSGGLAQVLSSDNNYLMVRAGATLFAREAAVQEVFTTHASNAPEAQIQLLTEAHANTPGLTRTLSLWNFTSGAWVDVGSVGETMSDSTFSVTVSNAQPYTDAQGQIKAKVSWNTVSGTLMSSWTTSLDYLHFAVVPTFVP